MTLVRPVGSITTESKELHKQLEGILHNDVSASRLPIGLIGCGWIGGMQLEAYRSAGFNVVAVGDRHLERAEAHRDKFFPNAAAFGSLDELLNFPGLAILDVATHPEGRSETILRGIDAGLHVLSQKPFVEDLFSGIELEEAARKRGVLLSVNQNGRWAPHFSVMLRGVASDLIGDIVSADFSVYWPHDQIVAEMPEFASMQDLILFDFGAHWFDLVGVLGPTEGLRVSAVVDKRPGQSISAPLQASATIWGAEFFSTVNFRAGERFAEAGAFRVVGTKGVITHEGSSLGGDTVELWTELGHVTVEIRNDWFTFGLSGAMGALLDAVESGEAPSSSPESAMRGLQIAFAALESSRAGRPIEVGSVARRL